MLKKRLGKRIEERIIKKSREKMIHILDKIDYSNKDFLDFGCGIGTIDYQNLKGKPRVSFYDKNEDSLKKVQKKYSSIINIVGVESDLTKIKGKFDIILLGGVIQYIENCESFIKRLKLLLKKDGFLIISTVNRLSLLRRLNILSKNPKKNFGEFNLFSLGEIKKLLEGSGFKIITYLGADFFPNKKELSSNIIFLAK